MSFYILDIVAARAGMRIYKVNSLKRMHFLSTILAMLNTRKY